MEWVLAELHSTYQLGHTKRTLGNKPEMPPVTSLVKSSKTTFQAKVFPGSAEYLYIIQHNTQLSPFLPQKQQSLTNGGSDRGKAYVHLPWLATENRISSDYVARLTDAL